MKAFWRKVSKKLDVLVTGSLDVSKPMAPLAADAQAQLDLGRAAQRNGDFEIAQIKFARAVNLDGRALCRPWGLLPHLTKQGRHSVRQRLEQRLCNWYPPDDGTPHGRIALLSHKVRMRAWADTHGFVTSALLAQVPSVADIDWTRMPDRVVIKPENASSNLGVVVAIDGFDQMTKARICPDLRGYVEKIYQDEGLTRCGILIEEAITDVDVTTDPQLRIPRDFKVFAVNGHAAFVRVYDRNGPDGKRGLITYDRCGDILPDSKKKWPATRYAPPPKGFTALVAEAERASGLLPYILRFDFYLTASGPVLGEITTYPSAGLNYSTFSRRTMLQMWEITPDPRPEDNRARGDI